MNYCECGCGKETTMATHTSKKNNRFKGMPLRYLKGHNNNKIEEWSKSHPPWNKGKSGIEIWGRIENHPRWIPDRDSLVKSDKKHLDVQYRSWMKSVKDRDGWKCKIDNSDCSGRLEAHHILPWRDNPELRYDINNGITLCHDHHPHKWSEEKRMQEAFKQLVSSASKIIN